MSGQVYNVTKTDLTGDRFYLTLYKVYAHKVPFLGKIRIHIPKQGILHKDLIIDTPSAIVETISKVFKFPEYNHVINLLSTDCPELVTVRNFDKISVIFLGNL